MLGPRSFVFCANFRYIYHFNLSHPHTCSPNPFDKTDLPNPHICTQEVQFHKKSRNRYLFPSIVSNFFSRIFCLNIFSRLSRCSAPSRTSSRNTKRSRSSCRHGRRRLRSTPDSKWMKTCTNTFEACYFIRKLLYSRVGATLLLSFLYVTHTKLCFLFLKYNKVSQSESLSKYLTWRSRYFLILILIQIRKKSGRFFPRFGL